MKIKPAQLVILVTGIIFVVGLLTPFLLNITPSLFTASTFAESIREDINMPIAIILLILAGLVAWGLIVLYRHEGEKTDIEKLEEKMNKRFDAIYKKLGIEKEEKDLKGENENDKPESN
jgi:cytochrome c biogenesis protein CcdA